MERKQQRYDRQLRLWGDHGQMMLESAHIALLNATITGTEILKGLVLPGVGRITIVDDHVVTGEDLCGNFFLDEESIGKPRGAAAMEFLRLLNPDVRFDFVNMSPKAYVAAASADKTSSTSPLSAFSLAIACGLPEPVALELSRHLWPANVPLMICRSYGFAGVVRIVFRQHCIEDTHDDNPVPDFRLDRPFPPLVALLDQIDLPNLSHQDHSHVPYLVLFFKCLELWRAAESTPMPSTYAEKKRFKTMLLSMQIPDAKGNRDEENFSEGVRAVNTSLVPTRVPRDVRAIFDHPACSQSMTPSNSEIEDDVTSSSTDRFWIISSALKNFVEEGGQCEGGGTGGCLPVRGTLPDMISYSNRYVPLLDSYRQQAAQDADRVYEIVQKKLASAGRPGSDISRDEVGYFCRNAAFLRVLTGTPLASEYNNDVTGDVPSASDGSRPVSGQAGCYAPYLAHLDSPEDGNQMLLYLLVRAADRFYVEMNRYPGTNGVPVGLDKNDLVLRLERLLGGGERKAPFADALAGSFLPYVEEMCRYAAVELHSTAALIGGVAAQECIKLVTKQFIPLDNTLVYNGVTGASSVFRL